MYVNARKMAVSGVLLALTVICIVLSGVLEFNTLFLLGLASFSIGIIVREFDIKYGAAYLAAAVLLGFFLAPNKLYCLTFGAMGVYVLAVEILWRPMQKITLRVRINANLGMWIVKFVIFNVIYVPILLLFPKLLFAGTPELRLMIVALIGGQVILVIYDRAYDYFQTRIWNKYRRILLEQK